MMGKWWAKAEEEKRRDGREGLTVGESWVVAGRRAQEWARACSKLWQELGRTEGSRAYHSSSASKGAYLGKVQLAASPC